MRAALAATLLVTACSGRTTIDLPALEDARSAVLLVEGPAPRVLTHAFEDEDLRVPVDGATQLFILLYREPLAQLGLPSGELARWTGEDGRRLPHPARASTRAPGGDDAWRTVAPDTSELFNNFRFAPERAASCVERGGCYPAGERACVAPCPAPDRPAPPRLAASVLPSFLPCPAGWTEAERAGITVCDPGDDGAPIDACPPGEWPELEPLRPVLFVRAGGMGDGTREAPLGSIATALSAIPAGGAVAVAEGVYAEDLRVEGGREVAGACTSRVELAGALVLAGGRLRGAHVIGTVRARDEVALEHVVVESSSVAIAAEASTRLSIDAAVLDAPVALELSSCTATITGALLTGETRCTGCVLRLDATEVRGTLDVRESPEVAGDQLLFRGSPAVSASASSVTLVRARFELAGPGVLNQGGAMTIEDGLFTSASAAPPGPALEAETGLIVTRRVLADGFAEAFTVSAANLLVTASTIRGGARAVIGDSSEVRVESSVIEATTAPAITMLGVVDRPGDTYQLVDLELRDVAGGLHTTRTQTGRIERVAITGTGAAIDSGADGSAPLIFAEDLRAQAPITLARGTLDLRRFELEGAGLVIEAEASATLAHGRITNVPVGIELHAERDPREVLDQVVFEGVESPCAPCGMD